MTTNNKIITITDNIKKKYDIEKYNYVWPDERKKLKKGDIIKYLNINYNNTVFPRACIYMQAGIDKMLVKSINSNKLWYIKFSNNYIFYFRPYFDLIENIENIV